MKITKTQLQTIIREEYVKVLFESQGKKISQSQAKILAENLEEGIWDSIGKGIEAYKSSRAEEKSAEQESKNDAALTKTELEIKKEIAKIRQHSKDMLKKHGWRGDENDMSVLGVDTFEKVILDVMGLPHNLLKSREIHRQYRSRDDSGETAGLGKYRVS